MPGQHADDRDRFRMHVRTLGPVLVFAREEGLSEGRIQALLGRVGLAGVDPSGFQTFISMNRFANLLRVLADTLGDQMAPMRAADRVRKGSIGVYGNTIATAPNLGAAIEVAMRYAPLFADVDGPELIVGEERARFAWTYSPLISARCHLEEFTLRLMIERMQYMFDLSWRPVEVHLVRDESAALPASSRELLGPRLVYGSERSAIVFRPRDLDMHNRLADHRAHEIACQLADRMMQERRVAEHFSLRVKEDILHSLASGQLGIGDSARRLGLSTRALQRRLNGEGLRYQDMVDDLRKDLAHEMLTTTDLPVGEIAFRLGFSNQGNLTRAFRRWYGRSPKAVRVSERHDRQAQFNAL